MKKIPIHTVLKTIHTVKGFPSGPFNACLLCKCGEKKQGGACCRDGVHADKESYDLIFQHKDYFEKNLGVPIENCFHKKWAKDPEFLGGKGIVTRIKNGTCIFRSGPTHGCEIVRFVLENNFSSRMIPSACRLYPITWNEGTLCLENIQKHCVCTDEKKQTDKSIFETQKKEIEDIFEIQYL